MKNIKSKSKAFFSFRLSFYFIYIFIYFAIKLLITFVIRCFFLFMICFNIVLKYQTNCKVNGGPLGNQHYAEGPPSVNYMKMKSEMKGKSLPAPNGA